MMTGDDSLIDVVPYRTVAHVLGEQSQVRFFGLLCAIFITSFVHSSTETLTLARPLVD